MIDDDSTLDNDASDLDDVEDDNEGDEPAEAGDTEDQAAETGGDEFDAYDDYDDVTCAERVLDACVRSIVDDPDGVEIDVDDSERRLTLHVRVASGDMGKIIGKRGRVANALRTLIKAAGARDGISATVEIDD